MRLMNDLGYNQLSNPNHSLKLVLMRRGNHQEHFFYVSITLGKDFISFHESILSNTKRGQSHLNHIIIFKEFISYLNYDILEISWPRIRNS